MLRAYAARLAASVLGCGVVFGVAALNAAPASAATVQWVATSDGFWDVAANWSGGVVPGPSDDVVIDVPHNTRVIVRSGSELVHSLTSRNPLVIDGGLLAIGAPSRVANSFALLSGTLVGASSGGPAELTVDGLFQWSGGCMFAGRAIARGGLLVTGAADKCMRNFTLDNVAQASFREGALTLHSTATINNLPGATFKMGDVCLCGGTFTNLGTLDKISGNGTVPVAAEFNNSGSVLIHSGGINLLGGGAASGSFWSNLGTQLTFGSSYALTDGATLDGPGRPVRIEAGDVTVDGAVTAKNMDVVGGALRVLGSLTARDVDVRGGALVGRDELGAQLTVMHQFTWTDGAVAHDSGCLNLNIASGARLVRTGGTARVSCLFILNSGSALWAPTAQFDEDGVSLVNAVGASFELRGTRCFCGFPGVLDNSGRLIKSGADTSAIFTYSGTRTGTVEVQAGELDMFQTNGPTAGRFTTSPGAVLAIVRGHNTSFSLDDGVVFDGPGDVRVDAGLFPAGTMLALNLDISPEGFVDGSGPLTVTDRFVLDGFLGVPTISRGTLEAANGATISAPLTNAGTARITTISGFTSGLGLEPLVTNLAGATMKLDGASVCGLSLNNAGRLIVNGATLGCGYGGPQRFTNSGSVEIASGTFAISGTSTQTAPGSVQVTLGGSPTCSTFTRVTVAGTATLGGGLVANLADGCRPATGQRFDVLSASTTTSSFSTQTIPPAMHLEQRPGLVSLVAD